MQNEENPAPLASDWFLCPISLTGSFYQLTSLLSMVRVAQLQKETPHSSRGQPLYTYAHSDIFKCSIEMLRGSFKASFATRTSCREVTLRADPHRRNGVRNDIKSTAGFTVHWLWPLTFHHFSRANNSKPCGGRLNWLPRNHAFSIFVGSTLHSLCIFMYSLCHFRDF